MPRRQGISVNQGFGEYSDSRSNNRKSSYRGFQRASFLILIFTILVAYTWAEWRYFTKPVPGGNDFLAHYTAWEAYFRLGYSPYSDEAAFYSQLKIRGRPAVIGEDQNRLTYPFYSLVVHAPFILIEYSLARAIYMTLLQVALFVGVVWAIKIMNWKPPLWLFAITLIWALMFYPQARGVILGQFAIFGFFSLAGSIYYLKLHRDELAGLLLVISTIKPTLVFLVVPFLLFWAIYRRRWAFVSWFLGALTFLVLGSFLIHPPWLVEWLQRIALYSGYTVGQSPVWLFTHQVFPYLGAVGELLISLLLLGGVLWSWRLVVNPGGNGYFLWALGITLVVSNLIVPRSATTNYVLMLIPTLWVFAALERSYRWGRACVLATMLISFVGLWWLHYATVIGNQEQPIMFLPYPIALGIALTALFPVLMKDSLLSTKTVNSNSSSNVQE